MISRLIDLLVIRALRSWASTQTRRTGWLAGLGEEKHRQRAEQHAHLHHRKYVQRHAFPVRDRPATGQRLTRRQRQRVCLTSR